jgi:hypothetical protein
MHVIPPAGPVYAANTSGCRVANGIAGRLEKEKVKKKVWKVWHLWNGGKAQTSTECRDT